MDDKCLCSLLEALLCLLSQETTQPVNGSNQKSESNHDAVSKSGKNKYPLSPASEAFAEVLICEIAQSCDLKSKSKDLVNS